MNISMAGRASTGEAVPFARIPRRRASIATAETGIGRAQQQIEQPEERGRAKLFMVVDR
jgi:hypothetical protein